MTLSPSVNLLNYFLSLHVLWILCTCLFSYPNTQHRLFMYHTPGICQYPNCHHFIFKLIYMSWWYNILYHDTVSPTTYTVSYPTQIHIQFPIKKLTSHSCPWVPHTTYSTTPLNRPSNNRNSAYHIPFWGAQIAILSCSSRISHMLTNYIPVCI